MAEKFKENAVIISQEEIAPGIFSMWLKTEQIAQHAKAGQFISIYCEDGSRMLPRPISICEIDKNDGALHLVYRVAGKGTQEFSEKNTGMELSVLGPLGNGFPLKSKKAFLIGGGIGIPPILELAKQLDCEKQIVLGYRNSDMFLLDEFKKYGSVYIATEDGSAETKGNVMDARTASPRSPFLKIMAFLLYMSEATQRNGTKRLSKFQPAFAVACENRAINA